MGCKGLFICTRDEHTKDILLSEGYQLVESNNGCWKFANEPSKHFSKNVSNEKISYTNNLFL